MAALKAHSQIILLTFWLAALSAASAAGSRAPAEAHVVCFYRSVELACVPRAAPAVAPNDALAHAQTLLAAMLAGPTPAEQAQGFRSALPDGARLANVQISDDAITIELHLPASFLYERLDPATSDMIVRQIAATLEPLNLRALDIRARDRAGAARRLSHFLFEPPAIHKDNQPVQPTDQAIQNTTPAAAGALSGKTIYVSAGHGWYWSQHNEWRTQRYTMQGIVEDFNNAEVVNQYLIQYLRNAGADVWPVRESDMNAEETIVAHDSPAYAEQGAWLDSAEPGYNGTFRYAAVSAAATATAAWTFTPTTSGRYAVYAWYSSGADRAPDAQYLVEHAGGVTEARVNQTRHGATWRYIGAFPFAARQPARITLTNQSALAGRLVVADAIRIGGGLGSECGDTPPGCSAPSGRPRWEEAARYWAKYQGAPPEVYDPSREPCRDGLINDDYCDDITARPRYAEWETPPGQDAVYISWHSNAFDGVLRGTESYIHLDPTPGSAALQSRVHSTLVNDIRAGWDPDWIDRGTKRADYGELRLLATMPGVLLEIAFHDQPDDANALKDPRFGQLAARAVYKGIVSYFAARDGVPASIAPEPPRAVTARNIAPGAVRLDWTPSPTDEIGLLGGAATAYRVYTSRDGVGWDNGIVATGHCYTLTGLLPGQLVFARVAGVNAGGESFPTPVVGARAGWPAPALIVDGFGRIDRHGLIAQDDGGWLGVNYRMVVDRINSFDYVVQHGQAIPAPFDSAHRRASGTLPVSLNNYQVVDWIAGEEQTQSEPIPPNPAEIALSSSEQNALQNYIANGGALFISGAEIGYDLVSRGHGAAFYADVLKADYRGDDADTYTVTPAPGSILDGLAAFSFDDGNGDSYTVGWPDYFAPIGGAVSALTYQGQEHSAALQYDSGGCSRVVYFGFPFETISSSPVRQAVMERIIGFLGKCIPPETDIASPRASDYNYPPQVTGSARHPANINLAAVRLQLISGSGYWNGTMWQADPAWVIANGTAKWSYALPVLSEDGYYTVTAQAWSVFGILDPTPASVTFALDTIAPAPPTPITPTRGVIVASGQATFVFSPGSDAGGIASYALKVDEQPFTTTATAWTPPMALADGKHTWSVRALDRAGNQSPPGGPAYFAASSRLDYEPDTVIWSPEGDTYYGRALSISGAAADRQGVAAVRLQIACQSGYWGGTWLPAPAWVTATGTTLWSYTLPDAWPGEYTITAQAQNVTGALDSTPDTIRFTYSVLANQAHLPVILKGH